MARTFIVLSENLKNILNIIENTVSILSKIAELDVRLNVVYEDNFCAIGYIYVGDFSSIYPLNIYERDSTIMILEGYLYDTDRKNIESILQNTSTINQLRILRDADGEYSIAVVNPQKREIRILVDRFSTLGYYYTISRSSIVISRIPIICASSLTNCEVDRQWLIERLAFGYHCTNTFIFRGMFRTMPASLTKISYGNLTVDSIQWCPRYDEFYDEYRPEKLAEHLVSSCVRRLLKLSESRGIRKVIVRLSGGLDSRIVAAAIARALERLRSDIIVEAYTHKFSTTDEEEVRIAMNVSEILGLNHDVRIIRDRVGRLGEFYIGHVREMLKLPRFHEQEPGTVEAYGTGGDKVLKPLGRLGTEVPLETESAVDWICSRYSVLNPSEISRIVDSTEENVRETLRRTLASYPERDGRGILLRYLVEARLCNWLINDDYTWYTWHVDLHLSMPYFEDALHLDPKYKEYFRVCRDVIEALDKRLLNVKYYNIGCSLSGPLRIKVPTSFLLKAAKKIIRGQRGSVVPTGELKRILETKLELFDGFIEKTSNILEIDKRRLLSNVKRYIERSSASTQHYLKASNIIDTLSLVGAYLEVLSMLR
ncbi:MAG: hypothetical protein GXO23_07755 [Crenarchaeota archaeon]|nr:hypothetical protein [Thermoproteota archaeon]